MEEKIGHVRLDIFEELENVYNEGDDVETFVLDTLKSGRDVRETLAEDTRWPVLYQLSPERQNLVEVMDIRPDDAVLELGAGMGTLTGAVARRCGIVDCVELSLRRSQANAWRNREHGNICIHVGNLEHFRAERQYDVVLLIGVLEYAGTFMKGERPFHAMLKAAFDFLRPGGKAYIAIENRLGMKYLAGCSEDHLGRPFVGIEGYDCPEKIRTFTHSELEALVVEAGFQSAFFYYPFPDYKLPSVIFSDTQLADRGALGWNSDNYDQDRIFIFDDRKALKSLPKQEFKMLSNSFLVEAQKGCEIE